MENIYKSRIEYLQGLMKRDEIDVYVVPTADPHNSEYVCEYYQLRKFLSGFTGSAGTLVVSLFGAWLFTDGRYYVQAAGELEGSGIKLMRAGSEGVPTVATFIADIVAANGKVGLDGSLFSAKWGKELADKLLEKKNASLMCDADYANDIFGKNRPAAPDSKLFVLDEKYAGESVESKLGRLRAAIDEALADCHVLSMLDDIAWLINIRGGDIECNPVALSYAIIGKDYVKLYIDENKLDGQVIGHLNACGIETVAYGQFYDDLEKITGKVLVDGHSANLRIISLLDKNCELIDKRNPTLRMKSIKNATEIENLRQAHIADGVTFVKFQKWLLEELSAGNRVTEYDAVIKLSEFRYETEDYLCDSFGTISAYGANAAMMHYSADAANCSVLKPEGFLLVDSGGQYLRGTTDSTRTICLGSLTDKMKRFYTATLKGMLRLADAKFLKGCTGLNLDILARGEVWNLMTDYRCGTGHGVGYLLNVHEGPNAFRWKSVEAVRGIDELCAGMVTTDEPGVYIEGEFGIRIENELLCVELEHNEYGQFLGFETLTVIPIDKAAIDYSMMDKTDVERIDRYNKFVFESLRDYLSADCIEWLEKRL